MNRRTLPFVIPATLAFGLLVGCASTTSGAPDPADPAPPSSTVNLDAIAAAGVVSAWATVLQTDGELPRLCLSGVYDSYPPQCAGPEIRGWDWDAVDAEESADGVTWGAYAVTGNWDGQAFEFASAEASGLYDVTPIDPRTDPARAGAASEDVLLDIQDQLHREDSPLRPLASWPENGYLFVQVIYDDGAVQRWLDSTFGPEVVVAVSALHDV